MAHSFGNTSRDRLSTCHPDLVKIMSMAIARSPVDFGIAQGARTMEEQLAYFLDGKSKLDPRLAENKTRAKHVVGEGWRDLAEAVDIFIYHPDVSIRRQIAYDTAHLAFVAGVVISCADELFDCGETTHKVRWGGNWDGDRIILNDQSFDDMPHFELIPVVQ